MDPINPFQKPGQWYKGALHIHTTCSDGNLTPEEVIAEYQRRGYHFLAVTDHDRITDLTRFNTNGFLTIPSVEVCYDWNSVGQGYHLVALGAREMIDLPRETPIRRAIKHWTDRAATVLLAHPYWSGMTSAEMMALEELSGLEIFNLSSHTDLGKGLSTVHWDHVLTRDKRWWGYAVDDAHWVRQNGRMYDAFGAWVWVKAERLEQSLILEALQQGLFYSSTGPLIHSFHVEDGNASVRCSDVSTINFIGQTERGSQRRAEPGHTIDQASHRIVGDEIYLRAECLNAEGRTAWTNPFFL